MSSLVDLPEEILIIIIKQLDIKSLYNLFQSCQRIKDVLLMQGVIKKCNLSCNTLAFPKALELNMIKGISRHLQELNVCGVLHLRKRALIPALKRMKCLKTLDVSYTAINILDVLDIYPNCPSLKNLTINFSSDIKIDSKNLGNCQEVFKNFLNIHFVVLKSLTSKHFHVLEKSSLETLKLTIREVRGRYYPVQVVTICPFKHFCIFMVESNHIHISQGTWNELLPLMRMEDFEYLIIQYNVPYSICASPLIQNFITDNFKTISKLFSYNQHKNVYGSVAVMIWDKKSTVFDEIFFLTLKERIKKILLCEITVTSEQPLPSVVDSLNYEWFHINHKGPLRKTIVPGEPMFKRLRRGFGDDILDYDGIFTEHRNIKLNIHFPDHVNITLSSRNNFLSKITYLSLTGSYIRYSNEFFNVLFRSCNKLVTLNVEAPSISPCHSAIARSIPLSQSIKNIRLEDKRIDFKTLFSSFTVCRSMENICIIDASNEHTDLSDFTPLCVQCVNLYSLHIQALITKSTTARMLNLHKNFSRNYPEHHVNFNLEYYDYHIVTVSEYKQHLNVFQLDLIKPV